MRWICLFLLIGSIAVAAWPPPQPAHADAANTQFTVTRTGELVPTAAPGSMPVVHPFEILGHGEQAVPEPSSITGAGLLLSAFLIRRRRTQVR